MILRKFIEYCRQRLYAYATKSDKHPDIKFIVLVNDPEAVETCSKAILEKTKLI